MASIMDMLAGVPFEETEDSLNIQGIEINTVQNEDDLPKTDLFDLSNDEDENMETSNLHSFYTEPLIIENAVRRKISSPAYAGVKVTEPETHVLEQIETRAKPADRTEYDDNVVEDVTGKDPSLPELDEKPYDPDNPDPNGPKYCHCRWGESGVMVECEECGEWYHDECIGLTEEETYNIETYYCAPCCSSNSDLVTKYKVDPVKLRQKIIDEVRIEEKLKKPKRKNSNIKPEDRATNKKSTAAKTPKTPRARAPKPKRVSLNEGRTPKRNKVLNKAPKRKVSSEMSSSGDDDDVVALVICEECGDAFPGKKALKKHSKKHEEQTEARYRCDECSKVFNTSKSLRDHEVIHSGVKPFSCMFCGEAFYLMTQLTSHTNSKHLNVRHQCDTCSRSYSTKPALQSHRKKVHGEIADSD